jgi:hypothetical protein
METLPYLSITTEKIEVNQSLEDGYLVHRMAANHKASYLSQLTCHHVMLDMAAQSLCDGSQVPTGRNLPASYLVPHTTGYRIGPQQ